MPNIVNIYVRGDNNGNYEGMTKEEILAAIAQATSGTIGDVDTGFVTKIKEQNKGLGLMFWVGTTAEYEALAEKVENCLYIKTDDTSAADVSSNFAQIFTALDNITNEYAVKNHASSSDEYGKGTTTQYGHLMLTNEGQGSDAWDSPPIGKAVSGTDGYLLSQRIKSNAESIETLQTDVDNIKAIVELPVGTIVISDAQSPSQMAQRMGYGTWLDIKNETITSGDTIYYANYFYKTE